MMAKGKLHLPADLDLDTVVAKGGQGWSASTSSPLVKSPDFFLVDGRYWPHAQCDLGDEHEW
jgi:hypothetical protein